MKARTLLCLALAAGCVGWWLARARAPAEWTGEVAPSPPEQNSENLPPSWKRGDYAVTPLARFSAQALVLSRCNYSGGHDGALAPTDLALGWGCMSDAAVVNRMKVSQDMRWFNVSWRGELPVAGSQAMRSCSNMHLIPADDAARREIARIRRHELVLLTGYLVDVLHPDGWRWRSSLSREDTGAGACEVVWVTSIKRSRPAGS